MANVWHDATILRGAHFVSTLTNPGNPNRQRFVSHETDHPCVLVRVGAQETTTAEHGAKMTTFPTYLRAVRGINAAVHVGQFGGRIRLTLSLEACPPLVMVHAFLWSWSV